MISPTVASAEAAGLTALRGFPFPVFTSAGGEARAVVIAERAAKTAAWVNSIVGIPRVPALFVVGEADWPEVAIVPLYGMPHLAADRLVVGQDVGPFWASVRDSLLPQLQAGEVSMLETVYGKDVDLSSFADLLVSHEVSHLAHGPSWPEGPVTFWLRELMANLGMRGYLSDVEPSELSRLDGLVETTWSARLEHWPVRNLRDMMRAMQGGGANYVWFELGLLVLAKRLWRASGQSALRRLVDVLRGPELDEEGVFQVLSTLDVGVGDAARAWPDFSL